jgi:hypothetical protein
MAVEERQNARPGVLGRGLDISRLIRVHEPVSGVFITVKVGFDAEPFQLRFIEAA